MGEDENAIKIRETVNLKKMTKRGIEEGLRSFIIEAGEKPPREVGKRVRPG